MPFICWLILISIVLMILQRFPWLPIVIIGLVVAFIVYAAIMMKLVKRETNKRSYTDTPKKNEEIPEDRPEDQWKY